MALAETNSDEYLGKVEKIEKPAMISLNLNIDPDNLDGSEQAWKAKLKEYSTRMAESIGNQLAAISPKVIQFTKITGFPGTTRMNITDTKRRIFPPQNTAELKSENMARDLPTAIIDELSKLGIKAEIGLTEADKPKQSDATVMIWQHIIDDPFSLGGNPGGLTQSAQKSIWEYKVREVTSNEPREKVPPKGAMLKLVHSVRGVLGSH